MIRGRFLGATLALLLAVPAWSAEVRLGWGDSPANGGATGLRFDCDTDAGADIVVISFVPGENLPGVTGWHVEIATFDGSSAGCDPFAPTGECGPYGLPLFWDFSADGCRSGAASVSLDFGGPPYASATTVSDPWRGRAVLAAGSGEWTIETRLSTSLGYRHYTLGRCTLDASLPEGESVDLFAGHEVYVARIVIDHRAIGCFGCCQPAVIFAAGQIRRGALAAALPTSAPLHWLGDMGCAPVPALGSTWGRLKATYR